ncbi:MAG: YggS family pyridoxal phosphate-dependent enzyme [Clostridia bacterium]|nr:YggS family pyridoxal phosphate-dependent enzyme [Clostridia bacterium]
MTERLLNNIEYNYKTICENIAKAAQRSGRKYEDITFLAATKTVEAEYINYAISLGLNHIGENRVQELLSKYESYDLENTKLHMIGHLQTNKVRQIVDKVDMIESVDSLKLAKEISLQSEKRNISTDVLIEVNIGGEESKSGISPDELDELICQISELPAIKVQGLMTIPPICENKQKIFGYFENMRKLFIDISSKKIDNISMNVLSMGMSDDYVEAIESGATLVRIGSALFGARNYNI